MVTKPNQMITHLAAEWAAADHFPRSTRLVLVITQKPPTGFIVPSLIALLDDISFVK